MFPESLEDPFRVRDELPVRLREQASVECEPAREDLFRGIDNEAALRRDSTSIQIEVANLSTVGLGIVQIAVCLADVDAIRNEAEFHAMRALEIARRRPRQVAERTRVGEIEFDFEVASHGREFSSKAIARKSAR